MHPSQSDRQMPKHLDKVLFGAAGVYFLLALMWAFHYLSEQKQPKTEKYSPNPADTEFIAYLQQSLNVINQPSREKTLVNPQEKKPSTLAIQPPSPPTPEKGDRTDLCGNVSSQSVKNCSSFSTTPLYP